MGGLVVVATAMMAAGVFLFTTARNAQTSDLASGGETTTTATARTTAPSTTVTPLTAADLVLTATELVAAYGDAVYRIDTEGCSFVGTGSGFAISDRHVVTNWHVVAADVTPGLRSRDGIELMGRVIGWDESADVAVVETAEILETHLDWAATTDLLEGQAITSLGYPLPDHDFSVIPGSVLSFVTEGNNRVAIRTDADVDRGSSGGPALTERGLVAGIVTEMDLNLGGFQFVPVVRTADVLSPVVESIIDNPTRPDPDCDALTTPEPPASDFDSGTDTDYPNPYEPFWAVVIESIDYTEHTIGHAVDRMAGYWDLGIPAELLLSDDFGSLNPGYYVVYVRTFFSEGDAADYCDSIRPLIDGCYARYVSWDPSFR